MNDKRIHIYLEDHLAMMVGELELITRAEESNRNTELGQFLKQLKLDVAEQKGKLEGVLINAGYKEGIGGQLKQGAAWLTEKLGRLKLNDALLEYSALSRVVELEALMASIQARVTMWITLDTLSGADVRYRQHDFAQLREQTEKQLSDLHIHHLTAIAAAFAEDEK